MNWYEYGKLLPLRILEEIRFWKEQEKEHTIIILALVPDLEPAYVKLLGEWQAAFASTGSAANRLLKQLLPGTHPPDPYILRAVEDLVNTASTQSREFIRQLYALIEQSAAILAARPAKTTILHFIRESEYFLGVLDTLGKSGIMRDAEGESLSSLIQTEIANAGGAAGKLRSSENSGIAGSKGSSSPPPGQPAGSTPSVPPGMDADSTSPGSASDVTAHTPVQARPVPIGGHTLPPLPYAYNALEPYIDEKTMRIHHDKHHQSYVDGLNTAEKKLAESRKRNNFELIKHWERELAFNGAGHYLHTIFWTIMNPHGGGKPSGMLAEQIKRDFGSYDAFKNQFTEAANKVEGGGWAMLVWSPRAHRLEILQAEKHQNLSQMDIVPLLPLDVWEHAYYLKHQNERKKYIEDWWNVVYWPAAAERYEAARKLLWPPY